MNYLIQKRYTLADNLHFKTPKTSIRHHRSIYYGQNFNKVGGQDS